LINLFGIESPGLTASLAIADWLAHFTEAEFKSPSDQMEPSPVDAPML
jgi:L-2-hydroxyglutarate oxidase LhgO